MKKTYKNFNNLMKKKQYIKFFYHLKIKILNNILNTKNLRTKLIMIENKNFSQKHLYYNQTRCLVI